ncbi:MAG: YhcG family protein [Deltaproteobacteria bacterium]|nr:YhcG family protein [Deltaproteobacteria bacterium]
MIEAARQQVAQAANAALTTLYWQIGTRIRQHILKERRAEYGAEIVATLGRQLGWSRFKPLIPMKEPLKREFYAEMFRVEGWSTRVLQQKIDSMLYERTALSKKPDKLIRKELANLRTKDEVAPDLVFQDPYLLDFLDLRDTFSEKDFESALRREVERFLLDLGKRGIHVAEYLTELPPPEILRERLRQALATSRARLSQRALSEKFESRGSQGKSR